MKIRVIGADDLFFYCPGCKEIHGFNRTWKFNDDQDEPTITPSILVTAPGVIYRCHSFITNGGIQFLDDCTHDLKGKTVALPDFPEDLF